MDSTFQPLRHASLCLFLGVHTEIPLYSFKIAGSEVLNEKVKEPVFQYAINAPELSQLNGESICAHTVDTNNRNGEGSFTKKAPKEEKNANEP